MILFVLFSLTVGQSILWEDLKDYQLSIGIEETCQEQPTVFRAIQAGATYEMTFISNVKEGFSEVIYTFNLYYLKAQSFIFSENSNIFFSQGIGDDPANVFTFCNSIFEVLYVKLHTNGLSTSNFLAFTITSITTNPFLLTNVKIYIQKCSSNCLKCSNINTCLECNSSFQLNNHGLCICPYHQPFKYLNNCVSQCPTGLSPFFKECKSYTTLNTLLFDDLAQKFELITDYNTTQRKAQLNIDGEIQAGPFYQNEAIKYILEEYITSLADGYLEFETFIFNAKSLYFLSIYFDENLILQKIFSKDRALEDIQRNLIDICPAWNYSRSCFRIKYSLNFQNITRLKQITIQFHLPLNDTEIYWTLNYIKFQQVQHQSSIICSKKQYNNLCVELCPATTLEVNSICQSITHQYEFAEVAVKNYTTYLEDIYNNIFFQNQYYNTLTFYQLYEDRYIFGGHKVWDSTQYFNYYTLEKPHYKIKIYMKILLIDPMDSQDQFYLKIEDKQYIFSKSHFLSKCFSSIGSADCFRGENIGTNQNDYLITFEEQFQHTNNLVAITTQCKKKSNEFYCAYFDFVILVALCPLNCLKCNHGNHCLENDKNNIELQTFFQCPEEGYYKYEGNCQKCQPYCKVCVDSLSCVNCKDNYEMIGNKCICLYNRVNAEYTDCQTKCDKSCSICQKQKIKKLNSIKYCSFCDIEQKKILNLNICVCIDGYYMDEINEVQNCYSCGSKCQTCKSSVFCLSCYSDQNRILYDNKCVCQSGYYEFDNQQGTCLQCVSTCKTCLNSIDLCTSCFSNQFRILSIHNTCDCQMGYYEDESQNCLKCNQLCESCENSYQCLSCDKDEFRILQNKNCECQEGYYENQNEQCLECYYTCSKCNNSNQYNQCTLCPSTRIKSSNYQDQFECQCKVGYYDDFNLNCLSCLDFIDPPSNHYCYSKCGDQIVQWNEECDDGNLESRDDCNQCFFSNSSCANIFCFQCQFKQCTKCLDGYYLDSQNQCVECSYSCLKCEKSKDNCTECKYFNDQTNQCLLCYEEFGYVEINNQCFPVCGDGIKTKNENCDDGNFINGDGCNQFCQVEDGYKCNVECKKINYIEILLRESQYDQLYSSKRHISFTFNQLVKFQSEKKIKDLLEVKPVNPFKNLSLEIQNLEINDFTDYSKQPLQVSLEIQFDIKQRCYEPSIIVQLLNSNLFKNQDGFSVQQSEVAITLKNYSQPSDLMIESTQNFINLSCAVLYLLLGLAILAFLFGGLQIFWNLLDTLQLICYLKYFNINCPYNLQEYFNLFSFAEFDFIKNYFNISAFIETYVETKDAPHKFHEEGYSTVFLINIFSVIIVFATTIFTFLMIKILRYFLFAITKSFSEDKILNQDKISIIAFYFYKFTVFLQNQFQRMLEDFRNALLRAFMTTAFDLNIAIFLQFKDVKLSHPILLASFIFSLLIFLIQLQTLSKGFEIVSSDRKILEQQNNRNNYRAFYEGINLQKHKFNYNYNLFCLLKKGAFVAFLVFLYAVPCFQIGFASILSLCQGLFLLLNKPLEDQNEQIKQIIGEIIFWIAQLLILIFGFNEQDSFLNESSIEGIGWAIISLLTLQILTQLIFDVKQHFLYLYQKYQIFKDFHKIFKKIFKNNKSTTTIVTSDSEDSFYQKINESSFDEKKTDVITQYKPAQRKMVHFQLQP